MIDYFEAYYETYGRSVELIPYESSGIANDEVAARADAVRIAEDIQPFMVWNGPAFTNAFADELAARGVLCLACTPAQPPDWYTERDPFVWSIDASGNQKQSHTAEFILQQLAGKPAEFGGDDVRSTERRFGLLYVESSANSKLQADELVATLAAGGVDVVETVSYVLDPTTIQQTASQAIAKLKAAGVTTVLLSVDPIAPRDFTREATAQQYFPEWLLAGVTLTDTTAFARTYDQGQWAHAFGTTALAARITPERSGYYRLYEWYNGEPPPAPDQIGVLAPFPAVFFGVAQVVGPDLTRERWAEELKGGIETIPAITQPYLSWGGPDLWPYIDHHGIDDATLIWWDPPATGPDEIRREGTGMWQYADGGAALPTGRRGRLRRGHSTPRRRSRSSTNPHRKKPRPTIRARRADPARGPRRPSATSVPARSTAAPTIVTIGPKRIRTRPVGAVSRIVRRHTSAYSAADHGQRRTHHIAAPPHRDRASDDQQRHQRPRLQGEPERPILGEAEAVEHVDDLVARPIDGARGHPRAQRTHDRHQGPDGRRCERYLPPNDHATSVRWT